MRIQGCHHYGNILTTILGHDPTSDPGIALRQWVHFQGVHNTLHLLSWDQEELNTPLMTMVRVYTLGQTESNKYVGS